MFKIGSTVERMPLASLRPTQITVGHRMVDRKRRAFAAMSAEGRAHHHAAALYPAVRGPDACYIVDHHHGAAAALADGAGDVNVGIVCDLSRLSIDAFWVFLDHRAWVHCYDERGRRASFAEVPARFGDLRDDPYRSLAASVQERGGFADPDEPFYEFLWANHLRDRFPRDAVDRDYDDVVERALALARSDDCDFLPGWVGGGR